MTVAATATKTIKVGTGVSIVVERNPIILAKETATLDLLSKGRFIFGVGAGWLEAEMADHGVAYRTRFQLLKEKIRAIKEIWTTAESEFHGKFVNFDKMKAFPKELLSWVEIDDADAQQVGTLWEDTLFHRKLCGEGALDVPAFIKAIKAIGYAGAYGVEIISETHRRLPLAVAAQRSFDTAIKQFDKLG